MHAESKAVWNMRRILVIYQLICYLASPALLGRSGLQVEAEMAVGCSTLGWGWGEMLTSLLFFEHLKKVHTSAGSTLLQLPCDSTFQRMTLLFAKIASQCYTWPVPVALDPDAHTAELSTSDVSVFLINTCKSSGE